MPPRLRAAADEPEQPLGLARIVDDVGERPELADEQDAEDAGRRRKSATETQLASVWNRNQNSSSRPTMPACTIGSAQRRGRRAISHA